MTDLLCLRPSNYSASGGFRFHLAQLIEYSSRYNCVGLNSKHNFLTSCKLLRGKRGIPGLAISTYSPRSVPCDFTLTSLMTTGGFGQVLDEPGEAWPTANDSGSRASWEKHRTMEISSEYKTQKKKVYSTNAINCAHLCAHLGPHGEKNNEQWRFNLNIKHRKINTIQ